MGTSKSCEFRKDQTMGLSETLHLHDNAVTHGTENRVGEVNHALPLRREGNYCEEQGYSYRRGEGVRGTREFGLTTYPL